MEDKNKALNNLQQFLSKIKNNIGFANYGEPAWPDDLLYIFPIVIIGVFNLYVGLSIVEPAPLGEAANPFATPLEILPEWYFFPTFNLLRLIPNKLLGVLSMASVPLILGIVPFLDDTRARNMFRRYKTLKIFLFATLVAVWFGIGATLPLDIAPTLGLN
uniref:Cytochrome b6/f complex subunit IV n=2 Tax=Chromera velia TaxID=505693 RepID=D9IXH6_9ALVE|nr:cytochrome b6/f complex subunit IV [Chromera velia]ADJ66504.1 cytochrome b6/f complex subunit IV [Chromera velia]